MTRALLLDLDNTLVDRDAAVRAWLDRALPADGRVRRGFDALIACDRGGHGPRHAFFAGVSALVGIPIGQVRRRFLAELPGLMRLRPDADALLRAFAGRTVIVSNGPSALQRAKIAAAGLAARIDHVVISGELGVRKPDPAIFARALAVVGCHRDHALMVGDHPRLDIDGARGAGIAGVLVRSRWFVPPPSVRSVDQLTEIAW